MARFFLSFIFRYMALEKFYDEKSGKSLTDPALHVQVRHFFPN